MWTILIYFKEVLTSVALIGIIGGLTVITAMTIWGYVKLVKWSLSADKDLQPAVIGRVWKWFVVSVLAIELGPGIAQATVTALQNIL